MAVILITGAGSGIGLALTTAYAARGDQVYAAVRNTDHCPPAFRHPGVHPIRLDVTSEEEIQAVLPLMTQQVGLPDIVINNAGINLPGTIEETCRESWDDIFAVNVFAPLRLSQAFLPAMRTVGTGTIVMMSSLSAEVALPGDGPYAASKAALTRAAEALHYEVAPFGIKVISLEPGAVKSKLNQMPVPPKKTIPAYDLLRHHMQQRANEKSGGAETGDIALDMIRLIEAPGSPAICPVGAQAGEIIRKLNRAAAEERAQLIRAASGL
jgi:NAD(P)-dependent dehydrogenase (short-subunit alcohol dehydrogenase family)|tara:strand:+ start:444 stop:1247 length:804 start_codon:yes stop_codon:yes gene_type:complete